MLLTIWTVYPKDVINGPLGPTYSRDAHRPVIVYEVTTQTHTGEAPPDKGKKTTVETTNYQDWERNQIKQALLRKEAFITNPSIYATEGDPAVSIFGGPRESSVLGGPSFPIVFTESTTPTEVSKQVDKIRHLENIILGRQDRCQICDVPLGVGDHNNEAKQRHFQEHRDELKKAAGALRFLSQKGYSLNSLSLSSFIY